MGSQLREIWKNVLALLENELTEISFNTWIKTINPKSVSGKTVILEVPAEFNKGILESRYSSLIQNAFIQVTHKIFKIRFITPSEDVENYAPAPATGRVEYDERLASLLNPRYTFDSFVIGNGNRFAHAASLAVAESPRRWISRTMWKSA